MYNTINWDELDHTNYFSIVSINENQAEVTLNPQTCGTNYANLPEVLKIPDVIEGSSVGYLASNMFASNSRIKAIKIPKTVKTIPVAFCQSATNLRAIYGTEQITAIGSSAFWSVRIKEARFPNLTELGTGVFIGCAYLEFADIGGVESIPERTFANCGLLREVIARNKVTSIGTLAFYHTRSLRELPLLADVTQVGEAAFLGSSINTSLPVSGDIHTTAFPVAKHTTNFWSGVPFTPCRNRITTKLSHLNDAWKTHPLLEQNGTRTYGNSRALFAVMHIHSAITGQYYSEPAEFINELNSKDITECLNDDWTGVIDNVDNLFKALGYQTEVHGKDAPLSSKDYKALVDALAHGAYVYTQVQEEDSANNPHGVAIYGINDLGEVCVLDSYTLHENFRESGFEPNIDIYTYTTPYQNITAPNRDFVIVYPTKDEPSAEWTVYAPDNTFTTASKPSDYPENRVTICRVVGDTGTPGAKNGILTTYRVGDSAYRTFMPDTEAALYLQHKVDDENWSQDWTECNRKDFTWLSDNQVLNTADSAAGAKLINIPYGVSLCAVTQSELPDGGVGYMTTYRLRSPSPEGTGDGTNENTDIIKQEWQPISNNKKYVRYFVAGQQPDENWFEFAPNGCTPSMDGASGEGQ